VSEVLPGVMTSETRLERAGGCCCGHRAGCDDGAHGLRIPVKFNVALLEDSRNPNAICLGAKAVAESAMSFVLGPYLAVKHASEEFQLGSDFLQLDVPLSPKATRTCSAVTERE